MKLYLLFQRRKKKTPTPIRINKMPPITPPTIAPIFDFFPSGGAKQQDENIENI